MKVCQTCGDTYKDYIDFCFNDGSILATTSAVYADSATEVPQNNLVKPRKADDAASDGPPHAATIREDHGADPVAMDETSTPLGAPSELDDDDRTVPRIPAGGLDGGFAEPERTDPTETDGPVVPPSFSQAPTEPMPIGARAAETTDPSLLDAPIDFEDDEASDDDDTPVLQEPVLAVAPPQAPPRRSDSDDRPVLQADYGAADPLSAEEDTYESAHTEVPHGSLDMADDALADMSEEDVDRLLDPEDDDDDDDEPAAIGASSARDRPLVGGGPTLAPSPPPVPRAVGATLPLHEMQPPADSIGPPAAPPRASDDPTSPSHVETRPLRPRPSSTPTLPSLQLSPGGSSDEDAADSGAGVVAFGLGLGAFVVGIAIVGVIVLLIVIGSWLGSSPEDAEQVDRLPVVPSVPRTAARAEPVDDPFDDPLDDGADDEDDIDEPLDDPLDDQQDDPDLQDDLDQGAAPLQDPVPSRDLASDGDATDGEPVPRESRSLSVTDGVNGGVPPASGQRPIRFESVPTNALIDLGDREPFRTPAEIDLEIGRTYRYTVRYPGYDPVEAEFRVLQGMGVLTRKETLERTPTAVPEPLEGPMILGPPGCRLRVDGTLMESEDIVGGTRIDEATGRPMVYLPFRLERRVLGPGDQTFRFHVVSGVGTPATCAEYMPVTVEYSGQTRIVIK